MQELTCVKQYVDGAIRKPKKEGRVHVRLTILGAEAD